MILSAAIYIHVVISQGANSYGLKKGVQIVTAVLDDIMEATGEVLPIEDIELVKAPREFGSVPEERYAQNEYYSEFAKRRRITVVLAPPIEEGWAGMASGICERGYAIVNAPNDQGFASLSDTTKALLTHEILHLIGAKHSAGGVMAGGEGITDKALDQVERCKPK